MDHAFYARESWFVKNFTIAVLAVKILSRPRNPERKEKSE